MSADRKTVSKIANHGRRKAFKVFAVNFHGPDLEVMEKVLAKEMEVNSRRKIHAVTLKDEDLQEGFPDESKETLQLVQDIDECEKHFESVWPTLSSKLEDDLRSYWTGGVRKSGETVNIIPGKVGDVLNIQIDAIELDICDFFVVIFGRLSTHQLVDLICANIPLQAIIHFIPCPEADFEVNFPKLHKDIDFLKKSPFTKNVGIFIESLTTATEYLHEKYSNEIYDQFTWYLYDIEMLAQQFTAYQADFVEINDEAITSSSQEQLSALPKEERSAKGDAAAVGVYLDNLCNRIEHSTDMDRRCSLLHETPFLENNYGRIIVEEGNELLRSALATQMDMVSYWRIVDLILKEGVPFDRVGEITAKLTTFIEVLLWESFVQRLAAERCLYDECSCIDVTEECQLYTLRRTMNKVVETKATFRLPTKLGFRDFCEHLAQEKPVCATNLLSGLKFDDTLHEVAATKKVYRFEGGFIRCTFDIWRHKDPSLSLEIRLFEHSVLAHRWDAYKEKYSRIRVLTRNGIACDLGNCDRDCPDITIHWPTDCQIRYVRDGEAQAVEQRYQGLRRLFTEQGCVISYLENETVEVLTPNGVVYKLYLGGLIDESMEKYGSIFTNVAAELNFVRSLRNYGIDCELFDVTMLDGRKLRVMGESVVEEKDHFLIYEWMDFNEHECYADRDDGVKMIWSENAFKCCYPCGTVITTTVVEDTIEMDFECRSKSTENILRKINPTLVDRVANKGKRYDTYVTYHVNYLMQHKNYASVCFCGGDKMVIYSPDDFKLVLKDQNRVLIDIGETLFFRITTGVCNIATGAFTPEDKQISLKLNLSSEEEEILTFQNNHSSLLLHKNGDMILTGEDDGLVAPRQEELVFLAQQNKFGLAFLSNETYFEVTKKDKKNKTYMYDTITKIVQLKPILPIYEQFCMEMPEIDTKLENFKTFCHKVSKKPEEVMEHVLSARVIHKLDSIPTEICDLVQNFEITKATLAGYLKESLDHFLGKKFKSKHSPKWKTKIDAIRTDFNFKNKRMTVYNTMLRKNNFPKYHEFLKCKGNLNLIDVNEFKI